MQNVKQYTMKYKILFIFSFILLTFLLFNTNSFANYEIEDSEGNIYSFSDLEDTYTYQGIDYKVSDFEHRVFIDTGSSQNLYLYNGTMNILELEDSGYEYSFTGTVLLLSSFNGTFFVNTANSNGAVLSGSSTQNFIYSDMDLYTVDGTLVFQRPVPGLTQVLEKTNPVEKFQTMIVGIIPYLIALVVGLVAFWKAWQLLLKELRKA